MSSLSATQADGYYVPPEYFDSGQYQKQSRNQFAGSHKGHNQFLQRGVVRFELPYKGICEKCRQSIGRGTRYNALKRNTGDYYFTTPIWEFHMSCRNCQHAWKIRTNPQQRSFDYVEGITLQQGQEEVGLLVPGVASGETSSSSLERLERTAQGAQKAKTEIEELQALQQLNSQTTLEDASWNAKIRKHFRIHRKAKLLRQAQASKVGWRPGMEWLEPSMEDRLVAKEQTFGRAKSTEEQRFQQVRKSSIFGYPEDSSRRRKRTRTISSTSNLQPTPETLKSSSNVSNEMSMDDKGNDTIGSTRARSQPRPKQKIQITAVVGGKLIHKDAHNLTKSRASHISKGSLSDLMAGYASSESENDNEKS